MRHDHHRHALRSELEHDVQHLVDHLGVERRRGFVEQHHLRLHGQGSGDRRSLLLTARQLRRELVRLRANADTFEQRHRPLLRLVLGDLAHLDRPEHDVLDDRLVGEEVEGLEHHADVGAQRGERLAFLREDLPVDRDRARLVALEAVDAAA